MLTCSVCVAGVGQTELLAAVSAAVSGAGDGGGGGQPPHRLLCPTAVTIAPTHTHTTTCPVARA